MKKPQLTPWPKHIQAAVQRHTGPRLEPRVRRYAPGFGPPQTPTVAPTAKNIGQQFAVEAAGAKLDAAIIEGVMASVSNSSPVGDMPATPKTRSWWQRLLAFLFRLKP